MRKFPLLTAAVILALVILLALSLDAEAGGRKTPPAVYAKAQEIHRNMAGSWLSCTDGSCFVTSRDGKTLVTVRMAQGKVHVWPQTRR